MRTLFVLAVAAFVAFTPRATAQPAGPVLEVRVPPVNDLLGTLEYFGDFANQGEAGKQAAAFLRSATDPKTGLEGFDLSRPIGLYGFVTKDVFDSFAVLMVPIADEATVLNLLRGKAGLEPTKRKDGSYEVHVPNIPAPVYFRFSADYAYVTVRDAKAIAPSALVAPKGFFTGKIDGLAVAQLHWDRLPKDVKTTAFGLLELRIADAKKFAQPGETPAQTKLREWVVDQLLAATKSVLTDGKTFGIRFAVDPKSDDLTLEATLSAASGSEMAKVIGRLSDRTGLAAGLPVGRNPLGTLAVKVGLADAATKQFAGHVDALIREAKAHATDSQAVLLGMALDAVAPTLKAGDVDLALVVEGPDKSGHLSLVGALGLVSGAELEKLLKLIGTFAPANEVTFTFDSEKVGSVRMHKAVVHQPKLEEAFGTKNIWVGFADDRLLLGVEPEGKAVRAAAKADPAPSAVLSAEVSVARVASLVEKELAPAALKELTDEVFDSTSSPGKDTMRLSLDGGDRLSLKLTMKGKAVKFLALLDQRKKKQ